MGDRLVGGRYLLGASLGRGGMGIVWRAVDTVLEREVAVKEVAIPAGLSADERATLLIRTRGEALTAARLSHPNIVTVHDVLVYEDKPWIVMELVDGPTLESAVRADGPLTADAAARLGDALLDAIAAAHAAGVIHRDIKPSNVLLPPGRAPRLTDFSIAKQIGGGTLTAHGIVIGTPGYIAPERITDAAVGPEADLFGLGATLYFAVEGVEAFPTSDPVRTMFATAAQPHRPPQRAGSLAPVLEGLLDKDPATRLTVSRTREMLRPTAPPPTGPPPPATDSPSPEAAEPDDIPPPAGEIVTVIDPPPAGETITAIDPPPGADPATTGAARPTVPPPSGRRRRRLAVAATAALLAATGLVALLYPRGHGTLTGAPAAGHSAIPSGPACVPGTLVGGGSAAQALAVEGWIRGYEASCPKASIRYDPNGSGPGQQAFIAGVNTFAASDAPLSKADRPKADAHCGPGGHAIHLPLTVSVIAVAYNLPGTAGLRLSPATLAGIFSGAMTRWDDARIAADNPGVALPPTPIRTVHRSDSSVASDTFTHYLYAAAGPAWKYGHHVNWFAPGGERATGAAGAATLVAGTPGAIGYVDWRYVRTDHLTTALIGTAAAGWTDLSAESVTAALSAALIVGTGADLTLAINYASRALGVYPIASVTYEIVCDRGNAAASLPLLRAFLGYAVSPAGQQALDDAGYGRLPEVLRARVASIVAGLA